MKLLAFHRSSPSGLTLTYASTKLLSAVFLVALTIDTAPVWAEEYVLGLGIDDVMNRTDTKSETIVVEYHADPFRRGRTAEYSFAVAGQVDGDGDVFVGAGVYAKWSLAQGPWFLEGSFMPGYYGQGSEGSSLNGNIQFRTLLGVGYELTDHSRISLALDHKSNAGIEDSNPGGETFAMRYTVGF